MPLYDFKCFSCNKDFEVLRSMKDESKVKCEFCKSEDVNKIYQATPVHWKCGGSYARPNKLND